MLSQATKRTTEVVHVTLFYAAFAASVAQSRGVVSEFEVSVTSASVTRPVSALARVVSSSSGTGLATGLLRGCPPATTSET